uniref:Uncharacterized protein n=1 Tax=Anopheles atroparvus TaxID=41427 RepID=A0A182JJ24_ANOAO
MKKVILLSGMDAQMTTLMEKDAHEPEQFPVGTEIPLDTSTTVPIARQSPRCLGLSQQRTGGEGRWRRRRTVGQVVLLHGERGRRHGRDGRQRRAERTVVLIEPFALHLLELTLAASHQVGLRWLRRARAASERCLLDRARIQRLQQPMAELGKLTAFPHEATVRVAVWLLEEVLAVLLLLLVVLLVLLLLLLLLPLGAPLLLLVFLKGPKFVSRKSVVAAAAGPSWWLVEEVKIRPPGAAVELLPVAASLPWLPGKWARKCLVFAYSPAPFPAPPPVEPCEVGAGPCGACMSRVVSLGATAIAAAVAAAAAAAAAAALPAPYGPPPPPPAVSSPGAPFCW